MKILAFVPYYPPHIGGLENYAEELDKHLSLKGTNVVVFTPRLPGNSPENETDASGVRIIRFPAFEIVTNYPLPKFWLPKFWRMYHELFRESFELTLSHTRFFNTSMMACAYHKVKNIPWLHIEHGSAFVELSNKLTSLISRGYDLTCGRHILRSSTANISISGAVKGFIGRFDKRESPVIYRGLDLSEIDSVEPDAELKNIYQNKIIIAFAGRLYKWKGVANSIEAIGQLPAEIKNKVVFLVIGDGEDFQHLEKISAPPVVMLGSLPRQKVFAALKTADIFIHSALPGGGLSTSLLEAMYCGCAIIATPDEGAKEVIVDRETGLLIDKSDSQLIKEKIIELCENPVDREKYAQNAKQRIRENFDWNKNVDKYIRYFAEILQSKHK